MKMTLTVCSEDRICEEKWQRELQILLEEKVDLRIQKYSQDQSVGQILYIDCTHPHLKTFLEGLPKKSDRAVFLVVEDEQLFLTSALLSACLQRGEVDGLIMSPFRTLEVLSQIWRYKQIQWGHELKEVSGFFSETLQALTQDLHLASRLQKGHLPQRFRDIRGFRVASRYLAGLGSGGDFFDLAEAADGSALSIILSSASSYGLSTAFLGALNQVHLSVQPGQMIQPGMVTETVRKIRAEMLPKFKDQHQLSFFYGTLARKTRILKFLNLGGTAFFWEKNQKDYVVLGPQGKAIQKEVEAESLIEGELALNLGDRLVWVSKGGLAALGGEAPVHALLKSLPGKGPLDLVNEIIFKIKSTLKEIDEMPVHDCTVIVLDLSAVQLSLKSAKPE